MLKRAVSDFRSKVSVRMMFIYAFMLVALFGISATAEGAFYIDVKLPSKETIQIYVEDQYQVLEIKLFIESQTGIMFYDQHLYYQGEELKEGSLIDYGIDGKSRSGYRLVLRVDGSYPPEQEPAVESVYEEPVFYALPEDEIGAYAIRQDGTKEYLLFHTYDICMDWLASDELCSGFEHCFHKDGK